MPTPSITLPGRRDTPALLALGLAGLCAFFNVYATQPLLPLLAQVFDISKAQAAWTVSAPPIAVALASPFAGAVAGRVGRRRMIVLSLVALACATGLAATAASLPQLVFWRFVQGLAVPGVYAVAVGYIGEVWQGRGVARAMSALITGNVVGGFLGRLVAGLAAGAWGWRSAFVALALLTLAGAALTARWLPPEPARTEPPANPLAALRALSARLDARLAATFVVGFNVLFTLVATFTYVTFHLSGAPFHLGPGTLSSIFAVYLVGALVTPFAGRWIDEVGSRRALVASLLLAVAGVLLTLVPSVAAVVVGLAACCTAAFVCQAASTSFLQVAAPREVRPAAAGVYVSCYYVGGSVGGVLPAAAWRLGGWPACVALVVAVQLATIALALRSWHAQSSVRPERGAAESKGAPRLHRCAAEPVLSGARAAGGVEGLGANGRRAARPVSSPP
ncbi:MAG: MFS transporter [Anaeromyxobacteraceae bacterium]